MLVSALVALAKRRALRRGHSTIAPIEAATSSAATHRPGQALNGGLAGGRQRRETLDLDHFGTAAVPRDESDCGARDTEPLGDRAYHRQVGGVPGGRRRNPGLQRLAVPAKLPAAGTRMRPNREPRHNCTSIGWTSTRTFPPKASRS